MSNSASFKLNVGTKAQVYHGTAARTSGGLRKADLMKTEKGRIVSKKAHAAGLQAIKRLRNAGFVAKKGEFKLFSKKGSRKASPVKRTMKTRAMSKANHKRAHNRAVKGWMTRKAKPMMGGKSKKSKSSKSKSKRNNRK
jgi:hypothetical protein